MVYRSFEELDVYKAAKRISQENLSIKALPKTEEYNLSSQMRRAALSLTINIAEGHGRYHYQENMQFCRSTLKKLIFCLDNPDHFSQPNQQFNVIN